MANNIVLEPPKLVGGPVRSTLANGEDAYQRLLQAARQLVDRIHQREQEVHQLLRVTENINRGLGLEEVLEFLYLEFHSIIPFNRIGLALIDEARGVVISKWAHSDRPVFLDKGFRAVLRGSTLEDIARTGQPRILNDLEAYLRNKPQSIATDLIVREGMRSSLTCPLIVQGRPVGFLFFSSEQPGAYSSAHVEFFQQTTGQVSLIVEKGRLYSELAEQAALIEKQNRQLVAQLELARQFQRSMIPAEDVHLPGLTLAFRYRPALQVGGDILDVLPLPDDRAVVFVGDAAGHGVQAAMVMAATKTALLRAGRSTSDPVELLRLVNDALCEMLLGECYVTAVCARLDPHARRADLALAGHVQPLHVCARDGEVCQLGAPGLPLGVNAGSTYSAVNCPFLPGDTLVFLTDGVLEAENFDGEFYGVQRLLDVVRRHGRGTPESLSQAIDTALRCHEQSREQHDDETVLVVQSSPPCDVRIHEKPEAP